MVATSPWTCLHSVIPSFYRLSPPARRALATAVLAVVFTSVLVTGAGAKDDKPAPPRFEPTTILVKFASASAATAGIKAEGDRSHGSTGNGVHIIELASGRGVAKSVATYRQRTDVVYAEPNYIRGTDLAAPNDPSYPTQWSLAAIRALGGWSVFPASYGSSLSPPLAVVDTGVDSNHPDLSANVDTSDGARCLSGVCVASAALDDNGHGTHVAGIAAAATNNGIGVAGIGFPSRIMPVKVLGSNGSGSDAAVASGITWAANHGAKVINLSLGGTGFSQTLCNAVANAVSSGVVVVAAAGNSGSSRPFYPASCSGAIGVAATASDGSSPSWSNWGNPNVFVSAPGAAVYSTYWTAHGSTYATLSGTSMASPHVAGLAALLLGQAPARSVTDVKQILARSADKLGSGTPPYGPDPYGTCAGCTWQPYYGYGEIDAQNALCLGAAPAVSTVAPAIGTTGNTVALTGPALGCATAVSLGYVPASFTVDSPNQITATVPPGVPYGYWRVTTGAATALSPLVFSVSSPNIASFSPASGSPGSTVTITGSGFSDASSVTLGYAPASFTVDSPTQITATVPSGVNYGRWRVANALWTAVASDVYTAGSATGGITVAPPLGPAGSTVTLTGSGFTWATAVSLGYVPASFTVDSPNQITATVPPGVPYGYWRVTTGAATAVSPLVFSVSSPNIASFSPASGSPGSTVTITGSGFFDASSVALGYAPASFTVDSPTQITATVPSGVSYGRWRVANALWTAVQPVVFTAS
jgi:thermitase